MAIIGKVQLAVILFMIILVVWIAFFKPAEANLTHRTSASGILTAKQCLACHSGPSSRKPVSICLTDHCLYTNEHPLLRRYPPPRKADKYATVAEITRAGCVLENGKITCLSCHNLTRPAPHLIRDGDQLCYICHKYLRPEA